MEALKYFIGKLCTISTVNINFNFKYEQMLDYFSGIIESIDNDGIIMIHPTTNCKNYIFLQYIVSISEEQVLYADNPEHAKIIEDYKKPKNQFVNPTVMSDIAKKAKEVIK